MLSLWPPLVAIVEAGTPPAKALAEGDAVVEESTDAVADSAVADRNTVDGDVAGDADADGPYQRGGAPRRELYRA